MITKKKSLAQGKTQVKQKKVSTTKKLKSTKKATISMEKIAIDYAQLVKVANNARAASEILKNKIKVFMGENAKLVGSDGTILIDYSVVRKNCVTDWEKVALELKADAQLIAKYSKIEETRIFYQKIY